MSNIFVNRNRSQGDYGVTQNRQKFKEPGQTWKDRGQLPDDTFYKTSAKYGGKFDYSEKYVGVGWALKDSTGAQNKNLNTVTPQKSNAETGKWKFFNNYERKDFQQATQEALKAEISNITAKIVAQRENKMNSTYQNGMSNEGNWRIPQTEIMDRTFNEGARYYTTMSNERKHGLKYIPPPKAENLQQLVEEQMKADKKNPNFLLNARYTKSHFGSRANSQVGKYEDAILDDTRSIVSMLSGHKRVNSYSINPSTSKNRKAKGLDLADIIDPERLQQLNKTALGTINERVMSPSSKQLSEKAYNNMTKKQKQEKILKNYKGQFFFPRRQRFNEDAGSEVASQRSGGLVKGVKPLNQKNLQVNLENGDNGSYKTVGSKTSTQKKNMTVSELSYYFKSKEQAAKDRLSNTRSACENYASPLGKTGYRKKFLKRAADQANPRYAASKASSHIGGLITGLHTTNGLPAHLPEEYQELDMSPEAIEEREREQKEYLDNIENQLLENVDIEDIENYEGNEDEMTFVGDSESAFFAHIKSNNNYMDDEGDAQTVATSAIDRMSVFSGANSSLYSRKFQEVTDKLVKEKQARQDLQSKIQKMKNEMESNQKIIDMQLSNDKVVKMMITDQRNCMQSAQNYTTHPGN